MITPAMNKLNERRNTISIIVLNAVLSKKRNRESMSTVPMANRIFVTFFAVV
jgi:hypothetical protein